MNCPKCGKDNPSDNRFCDNCGADLQVLGGGSAMPAMATMGGSNECPACRHINPSGSTFCENCGSTIQFAPGAAPAAAQMPQQSYTATPTYSSDKSLILPDGAEIAITARRSIGRLDLAKYTAPTETMWVSRQHFDVFEENGVPYIIDERSSNGTKLNGKEIRQLGKQQLKSGDEIIVGDAVKLIFRSKSP
jgi:hypothetical protein